MTVTSDTALLMRLDQAMHERTMQESKIIDRLEDIAGRVGRLEGLAGASNARTEDVARKLHDLRQELAEKGALKPEEVRAAMARDTKAMIDDAMAKVLRQMAESQEQRDRQLKWGAGLFLTVGAAAISAMNWLSQHTEAVLAWLKLWRGGL